MIAQGALLLWIVIAVTLFATMKPLRAFLLTYVIGLLFLPVEIHPGELYQGSIVFTQSLRIEKYDACNIGAWLGTLIFASHVFKRYRFHWVDVALGLVIAGEIATSVVNDLGAKEGISSAMDQVRDVLPLLILSRMYLTSVGEVYEAMRAVIGGAMVYAVICVWEWRFSPQLHDYAYGYFQHSFDQFMRYGHFRPAGFLRHAIEVSTFMALSTAMAGWLWYKKLLTPLWGIVPAWAVLSALLIGLGSTMTVAGLGEMALCAALLGLVAATRSRWILWVLPVVTIGWMAGRYTGVISEASMVQVARNFTDQDRADSLKYRLDAERENLTAAANHLLLGKGRENGFARNEDGRITSAVDAWWILQVIYFGIAGLAAWYLVWCACIFETWRRWDSLTPDLRTVGAAVSIVIGAQFVDFMFNSFPSMFLLMLDAGVISALHYYSTAEVRAISALPAMDGDEMPDVMTTT